MRSFLWGVICVLLFSFGLNAQKYVQIECVKNQLVISDKVCEDCRYSEGYVFTGLLVKNAVNGDLVEAIPYPMDLVLYKGHVSINGKNYKYPSIIGIDSYQDFYSQALSCFTCNDCDAFNEIQNITSNDGSVNISQSGNDFDLSIQTYNVIDGGDGVDITTSIIGNNTEFTITITESEIDLFDIDTSGLKNLVTNCIPTDLDTVVNGLSFTISNNNIELEVTNTAGQSFTDDFNLVWDSGIIDTSGLKQFIIDCIPAYSIIDNGDNTYNLQADGVDVGDIITDRNNTYNITDGNGINVNPTTINDFTTFEVEVDESEITLFRIDTSGLKGLVTNCIPEDIDTVVNGLEITVTNNNIEISVTDNAGQVFTDDFDLELFNGSVDTTGLKQFVLDCIPASTDTNTIPQQPTSNTVDGVTTYTQQLLDINGNVVNTLTWVDEDIDNDFTFQVFTNAEGLDSLVIFDEDGNAFAIHNDTNIELPDDEGDFDLSSVEDGNGDDVYTFSHINSNGDDQSFDVLIPDLQRCNGGKLTALDDIWYSHDLIQADGFGVIYLNGNDCPNSNDEFFDTSISSYAGSNIDGSNVASGNFSRVGNGTGNTANGFRSFIGAGQDNLTDANWTFIGSARNAIVSGVYSSTSSGINPIVSGGFSFNGAGQTNEITSTYAFNGSGRFNLVTGSRGANLAGVSNTVSGPESVNLNGANNIVSGLQSFNLSGNTNEVSGNQSGIGAGSGNLISTGNSFIASALDSRIDGTGGGSHIMSGGQGIITNSINSGIALTDQNTIMDSNSSYIMNGNDHTIANSQSSAIISGFNTTLVNVSNSVALGSARMDGTQDNTVYVPNLVLSFGEPTNIRPIPTSSADPSGEVGEVRFDEANGTIYMRGTTQWYQFIGTTF